MKLSEFVKCMDGATGSGGAMTPAAARLIGLAIGLTDDASTARFKAGDRVVWTKDAANMADVRKGDLGTIVGFDREAITVRPDVMRCEDNATCTWSAEERYLAPAPAPEFPFAPPHALADVTAERDAAIARAEFAEVNWTRCEAQAVAQKERADLFIRTAKSVGRKLVERRLELTSAQEAVRSLYAEAEAAGRLAELTTASLDKALQAAGEGIEARHRAVADFRAAVVRELQRIVAEDRVWMGEVGLREAIRVVQATSDTSGR